MADYFIENKDKINTVLQETSSLKGELNFKSSLKIKGKFEGIIKSEGLLVIAENAEVKADIFTKDIVISGSVKGNVVALNKLEIASSGKLEGNIKTYKLKLADDMFFEGECEMLSQEELRKLSGISEKAENTTED